MKKERGITLVALVITVIIMLILAGVSISQITGEEGLFARANHAARLYENAMDAEKEFIGQIVLGDYEGNYDLDKNVNKPKLSEGMIPIKYNNEANQWEICSEEDEDWYNYDAGKMEWANVMLSDGSYNRETAVIGTKVADAELGSMFVWIPRYAYSIREYGVGKSDEGNTQNITDVSFLVGTTNKDKDGEEYRLDYSTAEVEKAEGIVSTPKIVHPAFNFGETNLLGIWVAKFEASMAGGNNTNTSSTTTGDDIITKDVKVLPDVQSWRYIKIGNMFTNCLNMNKNGNIYGITSAVDSHLMKNSEWGAVAYLSASQYGKTPIINNSGSLYETSKYKAYTGGNAYKSNVNQSTTGNITGVYDMCGGAWEYVAAYYDNGNVNLSKYGTPYFEGNKLKSGYEKYWDRYEVDEGEKAPEAGWEDNNTLIRNLAEKRLNLMKEVKGVGIYDVKNTFSFFGKIKGSGAWMKSVEDTSTQYGVGIYNNDVTLVGSILIPFLLRGGCWPDATNAGVFASEGFSGLAYYFARFPPSVSCTLGGTSIHKET